MENGQRNKAVRMLKNMIAFCVLMENHNGILDKSPDYIMEKFKRYMGKDDESFKWGLDNVNMAKVEVYCERWGVKLFDEQCPECGHTENKHSSSCIKSE